LFVAQDLSTASSEGKKYIKLNIFTKDLAVYKDAFATRPQKWWNKCLEEQVYSNRLLCHLEHCHVHKHNHM